MAKGKGSSRGGGSKIGRDTGSSQFKQTKPKGRDLDLVAEAWETLRVSSGIGPVRDEADYDERVALLNALIDHGAR